MIAKMYSIICVSIVGWFFLFPLSGVAEEKGTTQVTSEMHGVEKICGVWEMHIHNMLNHQEYQYMLHVPPSPDAGVPFTSQHVVPSQLLVNGQTVYIRWDFPEGFSEDSLLLRRGGKAMDGTFMNFAGARGAVSGKLIRPCATNDE
ncbi:MAG: hypothetical protein CMH81_03475 [Nitrospiraceae bacterium]|jgi:hypothetical protein|nr:hypothetical protein [Nitrospiraceae bacterium]|tara:strand:- start:110 stop:547 length:438 start_codon:yes stop_codon:yes gene_type:complete